MVWFVFCKLRCVLNLDPAKSHPSASSAHPQLVTPCLNQHVDMMSDFFCQTIALFAVYPQIQLNVCNTLLCESLLSVMMSGCNVQ